MEKTTLSRTVFIGLGGTGAEAIVRTKSLMLDNFGEIPPMIKFLAIDTDSRDKVSFKNKSGQTITLDEDEFFHFRVPDVNAFVKTNKKETNFFPASMTEKSSSITQGAGQFRNCGRLSLIANDSKKFRNTLNNTIEAVKGWVGVLDDKYHSDTEAKTKVFIVFSIAGGSGAGLFIDFALLLKGDEMIGGGAGIETAAIALLPDVYASLGESAINCNPNALTGITEYEFIADGKLAEIIPDPNHPARMIQSHGGNYPADPNNLYDTFFMVNNESSKGVKYESPKEMADLISKSLFLAAGATGGVANSALDNIRKQKVMENLRGRMLRYLGLGCAEMVFEPNQVASYYSLLKANSISNNLLKATTEQKSITDEVQFCFDEWKIQEDNNRDDVIDFLAEPKPKQRFAGVSEFDESSATAIKSKRESYITGLRDSLNKSISDSQGTLDQINGRSLNNIQSFTSEKINKQGGLNYLKELLPNMIGRFKGMMDEMTEERNEFENQLSRYENTYNTKLSEIEDAANIPRYKVFTSRRRRIEAACDEYVGVVNSEATCIHEIERRTAAMAFYRKMIERAETILNSIISFEDRLRKVIESTSKQIQKIKNRHPKEPFSIDVTPEYIRSMILSSNDVDMEGFLNSVKISDVALWHHLDASELFDIITGYTNSLSKTKNYKNMTLLDALEHIPEESVLELFTELKESCELLRRLDPDYAIWHATYYEIRVSDIDHPAIIDRNTFRDILELGEFEDSLKDSDPKLESEETDTADEVSNNTKKSPGDIFRKVFEFHGRSPELSWGNAPDKITVNVYQSSVPAFLYRYFKENACELPPDSFSNTHWANLIQQEGYSIFPNDESSED